MLGLVVLPTANVIAEEHEDANKKTRDGVHVYVDEAPVKLPVPVVDQEGNPAALISYNVLSSKLNLPEDAPRYLLNFAFWDDGRVVFAGDRYRFYSEAPLYASQVDELRFNEMFSGLLDFAEENEAALEEPWFAPDASYQVMHLDNGSTLGIQVRSWHELHNSRTNTIVTDHGLEPRNNRDTQAVLNASAPKFQRFTANWNALSNPIDKLMPDEIIGAAEVEYELVEVEEPEEGEAEVIPVFIVSWDQNQVAAQY